MKARVAYKRNNKVYLLLENGKSLKMDINQANSLSKFMQWGDTGTLVQLPNGATKFILDADEILLSPVQYPATIQLPT